VLDDDGSAHKKRQPLNWKNKTKISRRTYLFTRRRPAST
jgi:hypothetical protein